MFNTLPHFPPLLFPFSLINSSYMSYLYIINTNTCLRFSTASLHESIMLKQSPSRNQRSKEFKLALEVSSRTSNLRNDYGILKLGRKGLDPQLEEIVTDIKTSAGEDDDIGQEDKLVESEGSKTGAGNDEEEPEQLEDLIDDQDDIDGKGSVEIDSDSEDVDLIK